MKKLFSLILTFAMLVSLAMPGNSNVKAIGTGAVLDTALAKVLETATGPLQVIVTFDGQGAPTSGNLSLLDSLGITTGVTMKALPIAGVLATKDQITKLAGMPGVKSVYLNKKLTYYNYEETMVTGVDKARMDSGFQKANGGMPITGKGVGVVINDSGVDGTHKDIQYGTHLVQNVLGSVNLASLAPGLLPVSYLENVPDTDNNSGHGTHVAGIVGGTGAMSSGKYEGVAPGANLIGYGSGAALLVLDGIGGFDYAITHQAQYNIRIITNSWGSSGGFDPNDPINIASKAAHDRGITVLFAAGNEGPGENTHNPYAKAPWVISVAAGEKNGKLADFSSRGTKGVGGTFEMDGAMYTWKDEPSITAPGVDVISTRVLGPVSTLGATTDVEMIEPAYLPYYTAMSGTSMATPHAAGIVALLLEAKPTLTPDEIKQVLQDTATNMPGYESWEVGAGYVNAYAALDAVLFGSSSYGKTVNAYQTFNSNVNVATERSSFQVDYNPLLLSSNSYSFTVASGVSQLSARIDAYGLLENTGNPVNLVLVDPDGVEYSSGISLLFTLYPDRTVVINSPKSGAWKVRIDGLRGNAANPLGTGLPETISGTLGFSMVNGFTGLKDIDGEPASSAIQMAVSERLVDGYADGTFKPKQVLLRKELARYLVMGAGIRQGRNVLKDVSGSDAAYVMAVVGKGAAIRDGAGVQGGVMQLDSSGLFNPNGEVDRVMLAYSLVQALGLEKQAKEFTGDVTVLYKDQRITLKDSSSIPAAMKGYVQLALDLNILNASFAVKQGPYDLLPTVEASFNPGKKVSRGDYAVAVSRYFGAWFQ